MKFFHALLIPIIIISSISVYATDVRNVEESVKIIMNSIRFGKHDYALKLIDFDGICKILMGANWDKMTGEDKSEFQKNIEILVRELTFPEGKKMFQHLDAILYNKPLITGSKARCKATIVVYRNYKKQENVIDFELINIAGIWKIVEMYILGEGIFSGIYEDEIQPVIKKGGIPAVMDRIRKRVAEVVKNES